jgi:hypothetical protein
MMTEHVSGYETTDARTAYWPSGAGPTGYTIDYGCTYLPADHRHCELCGTVISPEKRICDACRAKDGAITEDGE